MGNCWSKEGGKVTYSQKRDRIKMWVESQSNMEEIRSTPEQGETNLVRIPAVSNLSTLYLSRTSLNSSMSISSCVFFDALDHTDSDDEESAIFQEAVTNQSPVGGLLAQGGTGRRRELPTIKTETEGVNLWNLLCKNIGKDLSKISMRVTRVGPTDFGMGGDLSPP